MDPLIKAGVALVTGAGSGMGQSIAVQFATHGCSKLFLVDLNEKGLQETEQLVRKATSIPTATSSDTDVDIVLHKTNVSVETEVENMVQTCMRRFGRIDFAVNNAGIGLGGLKTAETSTEMMDKLYSVNEKGVFLCEKHEITHMLTQPPLPLHNIFPSSDGEADTDAAATEVNQDRQCRASIVNTASMSGTSALPSLAAYTSTKHAVISMTRVDARQYAPDKIRINAVCPGFVPTPMMLSAGLTEEFLNKTKSQSPMNRMTHPIEIAETVIFLSGSRASGITGVNLAVDAGATLFHVI